MFGSADEALKYIADNDIAMIDLKVAGISGQWLHITIPARAFNHVHFERGVGYDGSAGSGFGTVESGDVAALPEPGTAFVDPFWQQPTLSFICGTVAADTAQPFPNDPRTIARRAVGYMRRQGIADEALMAPEYEFHVFEAVEVDTDPYATRVTIHSTEVDSNGATPTIPRRRGYLRLPPADQLHDLRSEIAAVLGAMGVSVRYHHHEVGAPGQCELEVALEPLVTAADHAMLVKYVVKNVARRHGKLATFMPKPVYGEAGNGMHVHQKLDRQGKPLFYDEHRRNYADLSATALHYIAGVLAHGRALTGLTNPSTNAFKRLVPGFEAPVRLFFSLANRSAAIRVPRYAVTPDEKRIEYRPPDASGNVYATLAAMLMAGLDGIESKIDPGARRFGPYDVDIASEPPSVLGQVAALPRTLEEALDALDADRAFLTRGEVFPDVFLTDWIVAKRRAESAEVDARPHPYEYRLYLDV